LIILVDSLLAQLSTTTSLTKILAAQKLPHSFIKDCIGKLSGATWVEEVSVVLGLQVLRCGDTDKAHAEAIKSLLQAL